MFPRKNRDLRQIRGSDFSSVEKDKIKHPVIDFNEDIWYNMGDEKSFVSQSIYLIFLFSVKFRK